MLHYLEREGHHFKKPLPFHFSSSPEKKYTQGVTALKIIARYWTAVITVATVDHLCPGAEAYYIQHQTTTTGATVKCSRDPHGDCDYISSILTLWGMSLGDTGTCMQTECWQHKLHILTLWGMSLGDAGTCMQTGCRQHRLHNILTLWGMSLGDTGTACRLWPRGFVILWPRVTFTLVTPHRAWTPTPHLYSEEPVAMWKRNPPPLFHQLPLFYQFQTSLFISMSMPVNSWPRTMPLLRPLWLDF